jgi:hypothetical protein
VKTPLLIFLLSCATPAYCQLDSSAIEEWWEADPTGIDHTAEELPEAAPDSSVVNARQFNSETLRNLQNDADLQYEQPATVAESLWERVKMFFVLLLSALFANAVETDWGRVLVYVLAFGALVVGIMLILRVDAFRVFYSGGGAAPVRAGTLDENIHEIDFDKEIQYALDNQDYRRGVRLLFLYALKILSDKQYIAWEQGKTNHEYVNEVNEETVRYWLNQLSYYFDYAWYGNFRVSKEMFDKVNGIFRGGEAMVK